MGQKVSPSRASVAAGVDVGGTYTDLVLIDRQTGNVRLAKTPTTPENQAFGVIEALKVAGTPLSEIDLIVHGTTTTTNAVLERRLARTGLITTRGFRDILELGRRTRPQAYGMFGQFRPIIPRNLRLEVGERMDAAGRVLTPLDEAGVQDAVRQLLAANCESLVIHFLHAYANPSHERRAAEIAAKLWPNDHITLGHALLSESREFERGSTAAINASVQPLLKRYVDRLRSELSDRGYTRDVLVMNGNGGMVSSHSVAEEAVKTVMSGPASGVMAAAYTGRRAGFRNLITYDMGGTSTDVALIRDAEPTVSNETEIEYALPIHVPMVDVRSVGAGGGSIARINDAGLPQLGPESAGANPGPICYGRGGTRPTISDAHLILGRLNAKKLLAVDAPVSVNSIRKIFAENLGAQLGLDEEGAAEAVLRLANTKMAGAIRLVSISLGVDPRDFTLFAFGGAGPLHATALARELAIPNVLIPARPGITNALGCVVADIRHDFVNTVNTPLDMADMNNVHSIFGAQTAEGRRLIEKETVHLERMREVHSADMQFVGQTHLLRVDLPGPTPSREQLQSLFDQAYFDRFRVELPEIRANLINLNTSVIGVRPPLDLSTLINPGDRRETLAAAKTETRPVWFQGKWRDTPVYWRDHLPKGRRLEGPAIIEQMDTTIVIEPGDIVSDDDDGNILIEIRKD